MKKQLIMLVSFICIVCLLTGCGAKEKSLGFKDFSKKTTIEEIKDAFGEEDYTFDEDHYDAIGYEELTIAGIYTEMPAFFFTPDTGTLMRIEFDCSNKGVSKDAIEQMIKDLTKTDGKPTVEDRNISGDYCTVYYWNNKSPNFKVVAFLVDEDYVKVLLNYDWWFETIGF